MILALEEVDELGGWSEEQLRELKSDIEFSSDVVKGKLLHIRSGALNKNLVLITLEKGDQLSAIALTNESLEVIGGLMVALVEKLEANKATEQG